MAGFLIGTVARRTGLSVPTIRYYESIGLLARVSRSATGYRWYDETVLDELRFVKKGQALGFSLDEIREILELSRTGAAPCAHVLALARAHVHAADERIRELTRFRQWLAGEIAKWEGREQPTSEGLCRIIIGATDTDVKPGHHRTRQPRRLDSPHHGTSPRSAPGAKSRRALRRS